MKLKQKGIIKMKKYAIYARSATDIGQIEEQIHDCEEYIKNVGGEVVAIYRDVGASGINNLRYSYRKMIEDAVQNKFDAIIAEDISRLSRNIEDTTYLHIFCKIHEILLVTLDEGEIGDVDIESNSWIKNVFITDKRKMGKPQIPNKNGT